MKLAEALMERKATKRRMEELKRRIYQNACVQEGEEPLELPLELVEELKREIASFTALVTAINMTNQDASLPDGTSLQEAIIKKDMLHYLHLIYTNLADKATPVHDRYSLREIKHMPTVEVPAVRKEAHRVAKAYRELDAQIQQTNWKVTLQPSLEDDAE